MKKVGVKMSIMSIVSIVSTQVAPQLHHLHKKEGQLDTLLFNHFLFFSIFYLVLLTEKITREGFEPTRKDFRSI